MPENFGAQQSRTVSPIDRNWDLPVFLNKVPFLTSELNLVGQIASLKSQEALNSVVPSGWLRVGDILDIGNLSGSELQDKEDDALSGQVLTSLAYNSNSFKLISKGASNIALVNGWKILVQGSNAPTSDNPINIITLPDISNNRVDFVFLEVWKELVDFNDIIYPYGNVLANPIPTAISEAEIFYNTINVETTKRVQIRYRIRTRMASSNPGISLGGNPEGFGPGVAPIGGRGSDNYNTDYEFVNQSPFDPGLWISQPIAGPDSKTEEEMQEDLNTVDGKVYAIPMFAVYRRESGTFAYNTPHNAAFSKASGKYSDRPDDRLLDVIHKDDIVDLRHQVMFAGQSLDPIVKKTFRKIISGEHTSIKGSGTGTDGSKIELSGGSTLLKVDRIDSGVPSDPIMGSPSAAAEFKRRAFCNAKVIHRSNIFVFSKAGTWSVGDEFDAELVPASVPAVVTSIDGIYGTNTDFTAKVVGIDNNLSSSINKNIHFTVTASSNLSGYPSQLSLYIQYTVEYQPNADGFKNVPRDFLEVRKIGTTLPIATRDTIVPIRGQNDTVQDFVRYAGGNYTDNYQFGHELVLFKTIPGSAPFVATNLNSSDFYGYDIVGIKSIQRKKVDGTYGTFQTFNVTRSGSVYTITSIGNVDEPNTEPDLKITLYTKNLFFELSKQGRGVIETYEMLEVTAVESPLDPGVPGYYIDTGDKPIVAIGTFAVTTGGVITGSAFAYQGVGTEQRITLNNLFSPTAGDNINSNFPILNENGYQNFNALPTKYKIGTVADLGTGQTIKVPVLVHSYVLVGEAYAFFYKMNPYQGNITSELKGKIESEGQATITSEGSGSITLLTYESGTAFFTKGSRNIIGTGTEWLSFIQSNDYIKRPGSDYSYRVDSVQTDTSLTLTEPFVETTSTSTEIYEIFRLDVSKNGISNVIDRMPSLNMEDYRGESQDITSITSYIDTLSIKKIQDPLETIPDDFTVGNQSNAIRGRNGITLTLGQNTLFKIGTPSPSLEYIQTFTGIYKKVFQAYVFNKENTGRLYLMVISGETNNTVSKTILNSNTIQDTVDIFELIGRPLYK